MDCFRKNIVRLVFLLVTGVTFLNMSFFIAEVTLLNLSKDDAAIENVIKILIAGGFEEENETPDGQEKSFSMKEVDLFMSLNLYHHLHLYRIAQHRYCFKNTLVPLSGHIDIFSPPPEA